MNKSLRLFVAIEIPTEIKGQISSVINELKACNADVRWEQTDKLHLTLKFLGDTKEERLGQLLYALEAVAAQTSPFSLTFSGVGCFPNRREPRIIWVGAEDLDGALGQLVDAIETALLAVGSEKETRNFHAHATIGRVKSQRNVRDLLRRMDSTTLKCKPIEVSTYVLIRSELKPSGSLYKTLNVFQLRTNKTLNQRVSDPF